MEEDIKSIQEKLKIIESLCTDDCINKSTVIQALINAIQYLIARYKELEKYKKYYENEKVICNRKDYIPKSKLKEKIEEISGMNEIGDIEREIYNRNEYAIEILLELLED